jgi:rubredoxin
LTEEEASWERYDLSKLFQVTTANKLQNKLKLTIARIDAALGTHFADELKELAEAEKAKWEAEKAANPPAEEEAVEVKPASKPVRTEGKRVASSKDTKAIDTSKLKGWDMLSDAQKAQIIGVEVDSNGAVVKMSFSGNEIEFACPECGILSPESFTHCCPACGYEYPPMDDQS